MSSMLKTWKRLGLSWVLAGSIMAAMAIVAGRIAAGDDKSPSQANAQDAAREKTPRPTPDRTGETPIAADPIAVQPPPSFSVLLGKDGFLESPRWDDRDISAAERDADPWVNPRWAPFNRCLVDRGLGIADKQVLTQGDIDAMVKRINADGPFAYREGGRWQFRTSAALDRWVSCVWILETTDAEVQPLLIPGDPPVGRGAR